MVCVLCVCVGGRRSAGVACGEGSGIRGDGRWKRREWRGEERMERRGERRDG